MKVYESDDISAFVALVVFLALYIVQFLIMLSAWFNGWNYRVLLDYNHYNEFWIEFVTMILSIPFVISFLKSMLSGVKFRRHLRRGSE